MNKKAPVFYFLTESLDLEREKNEIEYLKKIGRVVLVSHGRPNLKLEGVKHLRLSQVRPLPFKIYAYWSKVCYLFSKIANTSSDKYFTERNVYTGNYWVRWLINIFWKLKRIPLINSSLPTYDRLYFLPFNLGFSLWGKKRHKRNGQRVLLHDAVINRLNKYPQFVVHARRNGFITMGNIKSWDNPFYSQFAINVAGYFVWSESMWQDVRRVHSVKDKFIQVWGARPFHRFFQNVEKYQQGDPLIEKSKSPCSYVGYAAAFCDELMGRYEMGLIKQIADHLFLEIPEVKILVRPYPVIDPKFYSDLRGCPNVEITEIQGGEVEYNNGYQLRSYRIGSDWERCHFLSRCDAFLSLATSFTIEAAIFGLPIVHFYLNPKDRQTEDEIQFFKRIGISDHLLEYFNKELFLANQYQDLTHKIREIRKKGKQRDLSCLAAAKLLERMGVPKTLDGWATPKGNFFEQLKKNEQ